MKQHAIKISKSEELYPVRYKILEALKILLTPIGVEVEGEDRVIRFDYKAEVNQDYVIKVMREE